MPMLPCQKCLENNWAFKKEDDNSVTATCGGCGYTANFFPKKKRQMKHGDFCKYCGRPVQYRKSEFNPKKLLKPYYFTAYYACLGCGRLFMSDKFKVVNNDKDTNKLIQ